MLSIEPRQASLA